MGLIPSERAPKTIIPDVEFVSFGVLEPEISLVKGCPGLSTGGTPLGQSGAPSLPGGECVAPNSFTLVGACFLFMLIINLRAELL